jgi:threonine dehydrogenase-like Zn-dependent dehydrogenase
LANGVAQADKALRAAGALLRRAADEVECRVEGVRGAGAFYAREGAIVRLDLLGVIGTVAAIGLFVAGKQLNLQFVLGYTAEEFAASLHHIPDGKIDAAPLIMGQIGLEGVRDAFAALANPESHAKVMVDPWQDADDTEERV